MVGQNFEGPTVCVNFSSKFVNHKLAKIEFPAAERIVKRDGPKSQGNRRVLICSVVLS